MKADIQKLLDFVKFTHEVRNVQRAVLLEDDDRHENDAEHGYQLALVTWYLLDNHRLKLNKYRCVGMAIMYDVIEVHSGDTSAHASAKDRAAHKKREKMAVKKLKKQWPSFTSLHDLIEEYEQCKTSEAKFVYALDKLMPIINIYLYKGRSWKEQDVTFKEMKAIKIGKIELSPEVDKYYQDILKVLEKRPDLFGRNRGEL